MSFRKSKFPRQSQKGKFNESSIFFEGAPPALPPPAPRIVSFGGSVSQRSSSKSSHELPRQTSSFNSALRKMQDFSRAMSNPVQEESAEDDVPKERFEMHPEWQKISAAASQSQKRKSTITRRSSFELVYAPLGPGQRGVRARCAKGMSFLSVAFIFLDLMVLPLYAFGLEHGVLDGITIAFWSILLLVQALKLVERSRKRPATWILEASLVLGRVGLALWRPTSSSAPLVWGIVSALQLLRLCTLPYYYECSGVAAFTHNVLRKTSREVRATWNISWMGLVSLFCLHCLTCAWFGVGLQMGGWTEDAELARLPWHGQYVRSMEWASRLQIQASSSGLFRAWGSMFMVMGCGCTALQALSRLPPSRITENMELQTQAERLLAVLSTALGVLFASIFTSVTNDISDLRRLKRMRKEAEDKLSDFLEAHPVPQSLEQQLSSYARRHMSRVVPPGKEELAGSLPHFLYEELCREAFTPIVSNHTLLHNLCSKYSAFQRELCVRCFVEWPVMAQETLFQPGLQCESLLVVVRGVITYSTARLPPVTGSISNTAWVQVVPGSVGETGEVSASSLSQGDWLCEHCLWTSWSYLGQARTDSGADMLCLSRDRVHELAQVCKEAAAELARYAALAVGLLNSTAVEELSDLPIELSK
ncbi:unnamed protein product [Symbiodinium sp. CCMP2592]|nr:unnamed protein product [Symbiodinium sp. CCMP2592]